MRYNHFPTEPEALQQAANFLQSKLQWHLNDSRQVLLLLSGGSNIKLVQQISGDYLTNNNITIFTLDERFSKDHKLNNSLQIKAKGIPIKTCVPSEAETLTQFAARFESCLSDWKQDFANGRIIATIGIGQDGHLAGISPFPEDAQTFDTIFIKTNSWVVGYSGHLNPPQRVTVTPAFIKEFIDDAAVFAVGSDKREAIQKIFSMKGAQHITPARLLLQAKGDIQLFTDQYIKTD